MSASGGGGGGWSSDTGGSNTARGTGYSQLDTTTRPYITNKNTITHCYNAATDYGSLSANRATYLATICTDAAANGVVSFTYGSSAAGGGGARFCVWNAYNRVTVATMVQDSNASWTYAVANTWRAADNSATSRVTMVNGLNEDGVQANYMGVGSNGAATTMFAGIGVDATASIAPASTTARNASGSIQTMPAFYSGNVGAGIHFISALEANSTTTASTYLGVSTFDSSGLSASLRN